MLKLSFVIGSCVALLLIASSQASPTGRIVGGTEAAEGEFPHQISLRFLGSHICGGSIISRKYVLTAAHCVGDENENGEYVVDDPKYFSIRAGSTNRFSNGVVMNVVNITTHSEYKNFLNDVALLELEQPLIFSSNIRAIPLASADTPTKLLWTYVEAISKTKCLTSIGMFSDTLICLAHDANIGACNGDSGGPAIYNGELVGVAGFVVGGCGTKNPDGYAKVFYHVDWIKAHANL